jgi:hypothetical protein
LSTNPREALRAPAAVGANVIAITVKQGNAVKVYTVTVTRAGS